LAHGSFVSSACVWLLGAVARINWLSKKDLGVINE